MSQIEDLTVLLEMFVLATTEKLLGRSLYVVLLLCLFNHVIMIFLFDIIGLLK